MEYVPVKEYEKIARKHKLLTVKRASELSSLILDGSGEEREKAILEMVNSNMRLVLSLTKRYRSMPHFADTLFDGNFGLIKAVLTYDYRKGRFSTWAKPKILTEIRNGLLSRINSPLSVTRYATELAFKINKLIPDGNGDIKVPDLPVARMAMLGIMKSIPLYDDNGNPIEVEDTRTESILDIVQHNDLMSLVKRATDELKLTEDELILISDAGSSSNSTVVSVMSKKWGVSGSTVRMTRVKLLWQIRRKILRYVGRKEYLMLSAEDDIPQSSWRY